MGLVLPDAGTHVPAAFAFGMRGSGRAEAELEWGVGLGIGAERGGGRDIDD